MYCAREMRGNRSKERIVMRRSLSAFTMSWASSGERNERCVDPSGNEATSSRVGGLTRRLTSPAGASDDRRADRFDVGIV